MTKIDENLPLDSDARNDATYRELCSYRKINHFNVVTSTLPGMGSRDVDAVVARRSAPGSRRHRSSGVSFSAYPAWMRDPLMGISTGTQRIKIR
jgi:hypothetical protein